MVFAPPLHGLQRARLKPRPTFYKQQRLHSRQRCVLRHNVNLQRLKIYEKIKISGS